MGVGCRAFCSHRCPTLFAHRICAWTGRAGVSIFPGKRSLTHVVLSRRGGLPWQFLTTRDVDSRPTRSVLIGTTHVTTFRRSRRNSTLPRSHHPKAGHQEVVNKALNADPQDGESRKASPASIHTSTAKEMPQTDFVKLGGEFVKLASTKEEKNKAGLFQFDVGDTAWEWASGAEDDESTTKEASSSSSHQQVSVGKMLSILVPERTTLGFALGAITVSTVATMQFPQAIGQMIDILSAHAAIAGATGASTVPSPDTQVEMAAIASRMVGVFSVGAVATFAHSSMFDIAGQKIGAQLRMKLFQTIMEQDVAFFDQNRAGELANRLSTDVHEVAEHLVQNIASFLDNTVRSLSAIGGMYFLSPTLTLYSASVIPAVAGFAILYGGFIKRLSRKHLDALAHSTHIATERFAGIETVLSFGQRKSEVSRYSDVILLAYRYARRVAIFQGGFMGTTYFVGNGALLGVLWIGAGYVFDGAMTAGQLASFCMYAGHLAGGIGEITESVGGFLRAQGSGARLFALLDKEPSGVPISGNKCGIRRLPDDYEAVIQFEDVSFSYPMYPDAPILRNVSLRVSNGEMLAVTGRSGCGKSSLMALLLRLYEPTSGRITLGGVDIRDLDVEWLRKQIGTVQQEPLLFDGTVFENIAYSKPDASLEEVVEACVAASVHDFIQDLPQGYDTVVGERGTSLSGGQKQRLAIARALLIKPRILLLDEATSALDNTTEEVVFGSLRSQMDASSDEVSALIMTHHLSALKSCDRVAVLDEGYLVEKGPFDSLAYTRGTHTQHLVRSGSIHGHTTAPLEIPATLPGC